MKALPLSDRIVFVLTRQPATARGLSQFFRTDLQTIRKTLGGLEREGLVERADDTTPALYRTVDEIDVEYRPSRILIRRPGDGDPGGEPEPAAGQAANGHCTAVTTRGHRCKLRAVAGGYCSYHAPTIEV